MRKEEKSGFLKGPVGNNMKNDRDDVRAAKKRFAQLGSYEDEDTGGDYITRRLDQAIRSFQEGAGLRVDGIMHPGGETERTVAGMLARKRGTYGPPMPEKMVREMRDSENSAIGRLEAFDRSGYRLSSRFLTNYLVGEGTPLGITAKDMDSSETYRRAMETNRRRFEDSVAKGYVDDDPHKSSPFMNRILRLRDGESAYLDNPQTKGAGDAWDRDIERPSAVGLVFPHILPDPDQALSLGAVKLRSLGDLEATRRGNRVEITGNVYHTIVDKYDFNDDTAFDRNAFKPYRVLAGNGKAKPFAVHGVKPQAVQGVLEIGNGGIRGSQFRWRDVDP